jgi:GDP-4-dehydro-6-deoxy-D-mannose reductase
VAHTPKTILMTGAAGFVGSQLADRLTAEFPDAVLVGADLITPDWEVSPTRRVTALDITDEQAVRACFGEHKPDCIVHLAAQSHVPTSFQKPVLTWNVNVMGTLHLLEATRQECPGALFIFISSSEVYGREFNSGRPVQETTAFAPMNPYAASKAAADAMVRHAASDDVHTIVLRPFNHVGPGQRQDFVVSAFSSQIAKIEHGLQEPVLNVGNLDAQRDFLDVRDVLDAYVKTVRRGRDHASGTVWNLCSGRPVTIQSVLDDLLALSEIAIDVRTDPERLRPSEVPVALGESAAAREALGWEPSTPWSTTLADTLNHWRSITQP